MKLYRIKDWNDNYENNRTRDLKNMAWIPVPNSQDGDGYITLVLRENGAAFLGAWLAILQVASKCDPRGTLLRRGKIPHDAESLAKITRLPADTLSDAITVLCDEIQWLETVELADESRQDATMSQGSAPESHPTDEERKNRKNRTEDAEPPTLEMFKAAGIRCGLPEEEVIKCFHFSGKSNFLDKFNRFINVDHTVQYWQSNWRSRNFVNKTTAQQKEDYSSI